MKQSKFRNWASLGLAVFSFAATGVAFSEDQADEEKVEAKSGQKELRGLMLTGGCCHDYEQQKMILSNGISERVPVKWTILHEGGTGSDHQFELLKKEGWDKDFDFVLYNICFAETDDVDYIEGIAKVHAAGMPALALHCTMHAYHWKTKSDEWRKFLGVESRNHGEKSPIEVTVTKADHPVMKGAPATWTTPNGELYNIKEVYETATVLAEGKVKERTMPVIWVNQYDKARVFCTTMGHHNETMAEPVYLDLMGRAVEWVTKKD